jgi:hypothetical protein
VQPAHDWAVDDERSDAVGFVGGEFHCTEPKKDDDQRPSEQGQTRKRPCALFGDLKTELVCANIHFGFPIQVVGRSLGATTLGLPDTGFETAFAQ